MAAMTRAWIAALSAAAVVAGCKGGSTERSQPAPDAASSAPSLVSAAPKVEAPARQPREKRPAPKPEEVTFTTADGVKLSGSLYVGGDARAPAVVLAHRLAGTRQEWEPLLERLFPPKSPMNVLTLDLRGHGKSMGGPKGKDESRSWLVFSNEDFAAMAADVKGAVQWMSRRKGGPPSAVVLGGSDIGATAVTVGAKGLAGLRGVALVSPGAALRGVDIYEPFGQVLSLPNLLVAATDDTTSGEPAQAMASMSKTSHLVRLNGTMHGAEFLGAEQPVVWDELADWIDARVAATPPAGSASASPSAPPAPAAPPQ
jgi:pimeloyl-ACP methyl ester carboxylesterase